MKSALVLLSAVAAMTLTSQPRNDDPWASLARRYVSLVLAVGQHDADYVDAYYGPPELRQQAEANKQPLPDIGAAAAALQADVGKAAAGAGEADLWQLRREYLQRQLGALGARVGMLQGTRLSFDDESQALYDAVAPTQTEKELSALVARIDKSVPGEGPLITRYEAFKRGFLVPTARLDAVFQAAIKACRERTVQHLTLPPEESFTVEYVTGKSWSGYNWYQGNYRSLIQVNTDLPTYIERALDLACHEGYPGHHVYNVLLEKHLVRDRGWLEFTVYPLFSPQSLIAEGTANYGIEVAFTPAERRKFERDVLFPLAQLDSTRVQAYYDVVDLVDQLSYAGNEAARRYLNGDIDARGAVDWLERYALMPRARAEQRIKFFDQYRSYVINYNLGKDLVKAFVERRAGTSAPRRWQEFSALLSSPRLPSGLR